MKQILCFGDSNTFGTDPINGGRHPWPVRWPGALQQLLGPDYRIIEEGLGGRTTVFDDPIEPGRCGLQALPVCLGSHRPLDLVAVMLGTNDLKSRFHLTTRDLGQAMGTLLQALFSYPFGPVYPTPKVLLISPIRVLDTIEESPYGCFTADAAERSGHFAEAYRPVAEQFGCAFFDAASVAGPSARDSLHMEAEAHARLAQALAGVIPTLVG